MSVLNLECNVVRHRCSKEHVEFSEWYFARVQAEYLHSHTQTLCITLKRHALIHLAYELKALLLVFPFDFGTHASLLIDCFTEKLLHRQVLHFGYVSKISCVLVISINFNTYNFKL